MIDLIMNCPSSDADALASAVVGFQNVIPVNGVPAPGRAAIASYVDADGTIWPAQPAVGDPSRVYVAVRLDESVVAPTWPASAVATDPAVGASLLGVWA